MRFVNDPQPWMAGVDHDLSVIDLVANGTLPADQAAVLWWALEYGASILTAGGPQGAGKSTLANALLPFLPDDAVIYVPDGKADPLATPTVEPFTYLLVSEFSEHGPMKYLSGPVAQRAFAMLLQGRRMVGTLHADSVDEALANLLSDFQINPAALSHITLIAITRITRGEFDRRRQDPSTDPVQRRVVEIGMPIPSANGLRTKTIATWDAERQRLEDAAERLDALAAWAGMARPAVKEAVRTRAAVLTTLLGQRQRSPEAVTDAVRRLRRQTGL